MKKNILRAVSVVMVSATMLMTTACNTKIKAKFDYTASDYVTLGEYKGIKAEINTSTIEEDLINKQIASDQEENTTYHDVTRGAQDDDQLILTYYATVGGTQVDGFSYESETRILGKDTFTIDGFTDALYGMKAGETKIVTLMVPDDFEDDTDIAGKKIVFDITMSNVQQPDVPMITDAYVKEYYNCDTVEAYKEKIKSDVQSSIDEKVQSLKNEAVLTQLQNAATVNGYPDGVYESKEADLEKSISFYSIRLSMTNDQYCMAQFNMTFDEYVTNAVNQQMILQAIVEKEGLSITEYEYKGNLEAFAAKIGYSDKNTFEEKYGKDKIVTNMLIQQAQDLVMDSAVITEK